MEKPNYYAIIPAPVRYSDISSGAKLLFGEITALCNKEGYCWATNGYFAEIYEVENKTITRWIAELDAKGFIKNEVDINAGNKRKIYDLSPKMSIPTPKNVVPTINTKSNISADAQIKNNSNSEIIEVPVNSDGEEREQRSKPKSNAKYPNARSVFALFPKQQKSWLIDTTQLKHAELLFEKGLSQVRGALKFHSENCDSQYCPEINTPYELSVKWLKLLSFKKKQNS